MSKIHFNPAVSPMAKSPAKINKPLQAAGVAATAGVLSSDKFERSNVDETVIKNKINQLEELIKDDKGLSDEAKQRIISLCTNNPDKLNIAYDLCKNYKKIGLSPKILPDFIEVDHAID